MNIIAPSADGSPVSSPLVRSGSPEAGRIPVGLRLRPELYQRTRRFAFDRDMPICQVLENALEAYMGAKGHG